MKYAVIAISVLVIGVTAFATIKKLLPDGSLQLSKDNWAKRVGMTP